MGNLLKYPALNTKIRGMKGKLLSEDELKELLNESTIEDALDFLKNKYEFIGEIHDRSSFEKEIYKLFVFDVLKLMKYLDFKERKLLHEYLLRYEISNIKDVFRHITTKREIEVELKQIDLWTDNLFKEIKNIKDVKSENEFIDKIKEEEFYPVFEEYKDELINAPIDKIEVELDKFYFKRVFNLYKDNKRLKEIIGKEIDLLNIIWIYRSVKYYGYDKSTINELLIPIDYKLSKKAKESLMEKTSFPEFLQVLNSTIYKNVFNDEKNLEREMYKYLYNLNKKVIKEEMFNICFIFSYLSILDIEIKNIINIVEGIRYKIDRQELKKKLIV